MITYAFLNLIASLFAMILGWIPSIFGDELLNSVIAFYNTILSYAVPWGNWVPLDTIGTLAYYILITAIASIMIRLVRLIVSLVTGGGGNV